jgi:autotransporter-associated beta strand protein
MNRQRLSALGTWALIAALVFFASCLPAGAANLYWDGNGATAGAGTAPSGTWGTDAFWTSDASGASATGAYVSGSDVFFSAGSDATGAFTVTVSGSPAANSVRFEEGTLTLSGGPLSIGSGGATLAGGTLKLGSATVIPSGTAVNVIAGASLDFNGVSNSAFTNLTIAGTGVDANTGALVNSSTTGSYSSVKNLTLAADASVGGNVGGPGNGPGRLGVGAGGGSTVNLAGHTLTKTGSSELLWWTQTTTAGTGGNLVINGGAVNIEAFDNNLPTTTVNNGGTLSTYGNRSENAAVTLNTGGALAAYNGTGTWTGTITLGGAATLNAGDASGRPYYSGGSLTLTGPITGTGSFTKIGGNTLILSGSGSNYSGATNVNAGVLQLGSATALGNTSGVTVAAGATVDVKGFNANKTFTIAGTGSSGQGALINTGGDIIGNVGVTLAADATIGVTGGRMDIGFGRPLQGNGFTLTKVGGGYLPIRSAASSFGAIKVDGGTLYFETPQTGMGSVPITVASGARVGMYYTNTINAPVTLNGGTAVHLGGGATTTSTWSGPLTVNNASKLSTSGGNMTITGAISGAGGLTIEGPNVVTLAGNNASFSGAVQVSTGILALGSATALGTSPGVTVSSGATVDFKGFKVPGTYIIAGTGTSGQGALVNTGGEIADYRANVTLTGNATIGGSGRFDIACNGGTLNGGGFTLTKTGTNMVDIRGGVTNLPIFNVNQGLVYFEASPSIPGTTINVAAGARLGMYGNQTIAATVVLNGGTLVQLNNGGTGTWTGGVTVNSASTITTTDPGWGGGNVTINGPISGAGDLTLAGTKTVTIGASGSVGSLAGTAKLALGNGVTFTAGSNGASTTYSGEITGAGGLTKSGAGTMTLSAANSYTGGTTVAGGTLLVNGSLHADSDVFVDGGLLGGIGTINGNVTVNPLGAISAGLSPGKLTIGGDYTQTGTMLVEIGGTVQGTDYDWLAVGGDATLDGTLQVSLQPGFTPPTGAAFDVLTASHITDNGLALTSGAGGLGAAQFWKYSIVGGTILRLEVGVPEPSTLALLAFGVLGLLVYVRRRTS